MHSTYFAFFLPRDGPLRAAGIHTWCIKVEGVHDRLSVGVVHEDRLHKESMKNKFIPHQADTWMWTPNKGMTRNGSSDPSAPRPRHGFASGDVLWFYLDCEEGILELGKAEDESEDITRVEFIHAFKRVPRWDRAVRNQLTH